MTKKQLAIYLSIALIWGCTWVLILKVVQAFGGGGIALRAIIGSVSLVIGAIATRRKLQFGPFVPLMIVGATTVSGQLLGFNLATPMVGTAITAIFAATIPMFSMVIGHMWKIEHISKNGYAGLVLGILGVAMIVGFPAVTIDGTFILGCIMCVFGAIAAAFGSNYTQKHLQGIGYWEQTIGAFMIGGILLLPMFILNPPKHTPRAIDYFYLIALAVVSTGIAYIMYFKLVSEIGATSVLTVEFLVTLIAVLVGAGLLGETLSLVQMIGAITIMVGCGLVLNLIPLKRLKKVAA